MVEVGVLGCLLLLTAAWTSSSVAGQNLMVSGDGLPATNGSFVTLTCSGPTNLSLIVWYKYEGSLSSPPISGSLVDYYRMLLASGDSSAGGGSAVSSGTSGSTSDASSSDSGSGSAASSGTSGSSDYYSAYSSGGGSGVSSGTSGSTNDYYSASSSGSGSTMPSDSASGSASGTGSSSTGSGSSGDYDYSGMDSSGGSSSTGSGSSGDYDYSGMDSSGGSSSTGSGSSGDYDYSGMDSSGGSGTDGFQPNIDDFLAMFDFIEFSEGQNLSFTPAVFGDEGYYLCASNDGPLFSDIFEFFISPAGSVAVAVEPDNTVYTVGDSLNFTCSDLGGPMNELQWSLNGSNLTNETESYLSLANIAATGYGGVYTCTVSNEAGSGMDSFTVNIFPVIVEGPVSFTVDATFEIRILECRAGGFPVPTYQWFKVGGDLSSNTTGDNTSVLTFDPVAYGDEGYYYCQATSGTNVVNSSVATLSITPRGTVAISPVNASFSVGEDVNLTCSARGGPLNIFQWFSEDGELEGENNTVLTIYNITLDDGGEYTCSVRNSGDAFNATTFVFINPIITDHPPSVTVTNGTYNNITCQARAFPDPSYHWTYSNGSQIDSDLIIGTDSNTLQFIPIVFGVEGGYVCIATANNISATSNVSTVYISPEGSVEVSPDETIGSLGDDITLNCSALGGPNNTFSWRRNTDSLNVISSSLVISNINASDGGTYKCTVTNEAGEERDTAMVYVRPYITLADDILTTDGSDVMFRCEAGGFPPPTLDWERIEIGFNTSLMSGGSYNITPVQFGDEGEYQCIANFSVETDIQIATLTISPEGSVEARPSVVNSERAVTQQFNCTARGGPGNTFTWTRLYDTSVITTTSELNVLVDSADVGSEYECTVSNAAGSDSANVALRVAVLVETQPESSNASIRDSFSLTCTASAFPLPNITWEHNSTAVDISNPRISITQSFTDRTTVMSRINIINATTSDSGTYRCIVGAPPGTPFGNTSSDPATVLVQATPERPFGLVADNITSTNLFLRWEEPHNSNSPILGYRVRYREPLFQGGRQIEFNSTSTFLLIKNLLPGVSYNFTVSAFNIIGDSPPSDTAIFRTLDEEPTGAPQNLTIVSTTSTVIEVQWGAIPIDQRNGLIEYYEIEINQTLFPVEEPQYQLRNVSGVQTTANIIALQQFVEYSIRVRGYTSVGFGPFSSTINTTTLEDRPDNSPQNVTAVAMTPREIRVMWEEVPPINQSGIITLYQVQYIPEMRFENEISVNTTNTTQLSVTLTDLEEYVEYNISVRAYTSVGPGPYSDDVIERTEEDVPASPPDSVTTEVLSSTEILVNWEEVPAIDENGIIIVYEVKYTPLETFDGQISTNTTNTTNLNITLDELQEYVEYDISVRAYTSVGPGPYSEPVINRTEEDVPGAPPEGVTAESLSPMSIRVNWSIVPPIEQDGIITLYEVEYEQLNFTENGEGLFNMTVSSDTFSLELDGLLEYVVYSVRVRAYSDVGAGPYSDAVFVTTDQDAPATPPLNISAVNRSPTQILVMWDPVPAIDQNGIIISYTVQFNQSMFPSTALYQNVTVTGTMALLTGLEEYVEYSIQVRASTIAGDGPYSDPPIIQRTREDVPSSPPTAVQANATSSTTIRVSWREVPAIDQNGIITQYDVEYNQTEFDVNTTQRVVVEDTSSVLLVGLLEYVNYTIRVSASTSVGSGPFSSSIFERTLEDVPSAPPAEVSVVNVTSTTISLTWDEVSPIDRNGIVTQYEVEYNQTTFSRTTQSIRVNSTMVELTSLHEYVVYSIRVRAYTSIGYGPYSPTVNQSTAEDAPHGSPRDLVVRNTSANSLSVSWQRPPDIDINGVLDSYEIDYYIENEVGTLASVTVDGQNLSVALNGLNNYTNYSVSVYAVTIGRGPPISAVERTSENVPGEPPEVVSAMNTSSTTILVMWLPPPEEFIFGILRGFVIRYFIIGSVTQEIIIQSPSVTMQEIDDLEEFTTYSIEVSAVTIGRGLFSIPEIVRTNEDIPGPVAQPPPPVFITSTSANISWSKPDDPNGIITRYTIRYVAVSMANGQPIIPVCIDGGEESINRIDEVISDNSPGPFFQILSRLTPFLTYRFSVQAETSIGKGDFSIPTLFDTEEEVPNAPRELTVEYINSTSLLVTWEPPQCDYGIRTQYRLDHEALPEPQPRGKTDPNVPLLGPDVTMFILTNLSPNTNYTVFLTARTSSNNIGLTANVTNQTNEDAPLGITDLDITSMPMSSSEVEVQISWTPPSDRNGSFKTRLTLSGQQTLPYPPQRSNSTSANIDILPQSQDFSTIPRALPYAEYTVTIQPYNVKTGNLAPETKTTIRTIAIEPTVVIDLRAEGGNRSISVSWDLPRYPNAPLSSYDVYYRKISDDTIGFDPSTALQDPNNVHVESYSLKTVTGANSTQAVITSLEVFRYYSVIVRAVGSSDGTAVLHGAFLEVIARTFSDVPEPPAPIEEPTSESRNTITIVLPDHTYITEGEIIFYAVIVIRGEPTEGSAPEDYDDALAYDMNNRDRQYYITVAWAGENITKIPDTYIVGDETVAYADGVQYLNAKLGSDSSYTIFTWIDLKSDNNKLLRVRTNYVLARTDELPVDVAGPAAGSIFGILLAIGLVSAVILAIFFFLKMRRSKKLDIVGGEVGHDMQDMANQGPVTAISSHVIANPLAAPHKGTLQPISVRDFPDHVTRLHANDDFLFAEEYTAVEPDHAPMSEVCLSPRNQSKNRYANIKAYDHSRVKLSEIPNEPGSDYINANRVDGYRQANAFIATQGPVPGTVTDFWRMVWEQGTATIVMLTNLEEKGRIKCHKYWPDELERTKELGSMRVYFQDSLVLAEYTSRTFSLQMEGSKEERIVKQFHYTVWPDHGVPDYPTPLLQFVRKVHSSNPINAGPIIVHCSAGVGRTGTFITLDAQLKMIKNEGIIDIFGFVQNMRRRRCYMVQTEQQYIFLHDALLEAIECDLTEVPARDLQKQFLKLSDIDPATGKPAFDKVLQKLQKTLHVRTARSVSTLPVNLPKNRYTDRDILPYDNSRCRLKSIPGAKGSDYINASYVNGYYRRKEFIATQGPLPDTENDFWRMVWEQKSSTIVMLTKSKEDDGKVKCHMYWPSSGAGQYGELQVILLSTTPYSDYTLREFNMVDMKDGSSRQVKHFQYTDWPEKSVPATGSAVIDLIGQVQRWQRSTDNRPVIVHCSGGCGRTGTYVAVSILIERLKTEGVVDVFQTVRKLRMQRPGMVASPEQYKFCYHTLIEFLDSFELYANFK